MRDEDFILYSSFFANVNLCMCPSCFHGPFCHFHMLCYCHLLLCHVFWGSQKYVSVACLFIDLLLCLAVYITCALYACAVAKRRGFGGSIFRAIMHYCTYFVTERVVFSCLRTNTD